ncbi:hypothetical protein BKA81DRAFT_17590 [Phyllosticta paracitricarpa]
MCVASGSCSCLGRPGRPRLTSEAILLAVLMDWRTSALPLETTSTRTAPEAPTRILRPVAVDSGIWILLLILTLLGLKRSRPCRRRIGNRTGDRVRGFVDIQLLLNCLRNRLDLGAELLLNLVQIETVVPVNKVDGQTQVAKTTRTANTVKVSLGVLGEVKVDDNVDGLNVDTTGEKVRANQVAANTVPEVVENAVASVLKHFGVRVEARVAELGNLLGEELHAVCGVAEYDGLVNLELVEKSVEAVNLLLFFDKSIVLRYSAKSEFVHQVDFVGRVHVFFLAKLVS